MELIGRYIFRQALVAFLASLTTLTAIVWLTQVLREIDVITIQGQTFATFLVITVLSLPAFASAIAPIALFIAVIHTLYRLNSDSELVVLNAAGISRWRMFSPFLALAAMVAVLVTIMNAYLMPQSLSTLRVLITEAQADLISHVLQPGRFSTPEKGLTFHIRERSPPGELLGLLVVDARETRQHLTYIAERGRIVKNDEGTFLVMEDGNVQRREKDKDGQVQIVSFDRYLIDIAQLARPASTEVVYKPRERSIGFLLNPDPKDPYYKNNPLRFSSELHQRLSSPLLPFALSLIAIALIGSARTTRQGSEIAIGLAIAGAVVTEIFLYGAINLTLKYAWAAALIYLVPLTGIAGGGMVAFTGLRISTEPVVAAYSAFANWFGGLVAAGLARYGRHP